MASQRSNPEGKKPKLTTEEQLAHIQQVLAAKVQAGVYEKPGRGVSGKELKRRLGIE
jgi:hypothetical protein